MHVVLVIVIGAVLTGLVEAIYCGEDNCYSCMARTNIYR